MKKVTIYSTPTCTYCKKAKVYFAEHGVTYEEFDVAGNAEKRQEMVELSGQLGVPVIRIADDVIVGFDQPMIAELLGVK